jgi:regulatory protein
MLFGKKTKAKNPADHEHAYSYAIFLLSLRLRTEGEIREKMLGRGYLSTVIDQVIAMLIDQKYIDDQRYAEVFLDNLKRYKNFGYYGIKKKLLEKKLSNYLIESVLEEHLTLEDEIDIAKRFLKKEHAAIGALNFVEKQKLTQRLRARGFRNEVVSKLLF